MCLCNRRMQQFLIITFLGNLKRTTLQLSESVSLDFGRPLQLLATQVGIAFDEKKLRKIYKSFTHNIIEQIAPCLENQRVHLSNLF